MNTVAEDSVQRLVRIVAEALRPLSVAAHDVTVVNGGYAALGWSPPPGVDLATLALPDVSKLVTDLDALAAAEAEVSPGPSGGTVDAARYAELVVHLGEVMAAVDAFAQDVATGAGEWAKETNIENQLPRRLLDLLLVWSLGWRIPSVAAIGQVLGLLRVRLAPADAKKFEIAGPRYEVMWERFGLVLSDPRQLMVDEYGWGTANFDASTLLQRVVLVLDALGGRAIVRDMPLALQGILAGKPAPTADPSAQLRVSLYRPAGAGGLDTGLSIHELRTTVAGGADAGLELMPYVSSQLDTELPLGQYARLTLETNLDVSSGVAVAVRPGDVQFRAGLLDGGSPASGYLKVGVRYAPPADSPTTLLVFPGGSRLELAQARVVVGAELDPSGQPDALLELRLEGLHLVIRLDEADSFLRKVLPSDGIEGRFDLGLRWSQRHGLRFMGAGELEVAIPVQAQLGPLELQQLKVALGVADDGHIVVGLTASGSVTLGPIEASVKDVGVRGELALERGNLGPVDLALGFNPPSGAALAIDAGPVSGGGLLDFNDAKKQYSGLIELSFSGISLTAIGLITTRMPDGSEGFSLLVIVAAEFPPIQLGFGFTLLGAGGLLGVNRTVAVDVLRDGIRNGSLNSVLFPEDPVRNAPQIIEQLSAAFPPAANRYIFGPMAKVGWGVPTLMFIELGIALELPAPVRLIIMGRLKLVLPEEHVGLVQIKVDVLGIIDFDRSEASVDASLYDSRLATFTISGDMAMRAKWGSDSNFALAAGGFNPRYTPPPGFPALRRLSIALGTGDNPRLTLESYLATTSNTFQIGAKLSAYAAVDLGFIGLFSVEGYFGFDVLLHFSPFSFIADVAAGAVLKRNGEDLLVVHVHLTLTGPKPLHAWGNATFTFFGRRSIDVDITLGSDSPPEQLPTADPLPLLMAALTAHGSWEAQMPAGNEMLVTLNPAAPADRVLAHPLGRLSVRERVVPLNVDIERFGNARPVADRRFTIEATIGGQPPDPAPETFREEFAPAQFFDLSDDEKLSRPSFEPMDGGLRIGTSKTSRGTAVATDLVYETSIIDYREFRVITGYALYRPQADQLYAHARISAAGRSPMSTSGDARYAGKPIGVAVRDAHYVGASTDDLSATGTPTPSYTEARQELDATRRDPRDVQIVREYEVAA